MHRLFDMNCGVWKKSLRCSDASGFTLVETIVASVILFTCLGAANLSYNTAMNLVSRTDSAIRIAAVQSDIRAVIRNQLFSGTLQGETRYAEDITYTWQAARRKWSRNIVGSSLETTGELEYGNFMLVLYHVSLTVNCTSNSQGRQSEFDYQELVWTPLQ